jgi:hypothetical protein
VPKRPSVALQAPQHNLPYILRALQHLSPGPHAFLNIRSCPSSSSMLIFGYTVPGSRFHSRPPSNEDRSVPGLITCHQIQNCSRESWMHSFSIGVLPWRTRGFLSQVGNLLVESPPQRVSEVRILPKHIVTYVLV